MKRGPLSVKVVKQLERLGCTLSAPKRSKQPAKNDTFVVLEKSAGEWQSAKKRWEWAAGASEFPTASAVRYFLDGVKWKRRAFCRAPEYDEDDERTTVEVSSLSENYEFHERKRRRVLYTFAWDRTTQYLFTLDLLDAGADPTVYHVDHDGSSFSEGDSLSSFLATLEPA